MIKMKKLKYTDADGEFYTKRILSKKYKEWIDLMFINIGNGIYSSLYITNTGFMKLLIHFTKYNEDSRHKHIFKNIKQIGEKGMDINEII